MNIFYFKVFLLIFSLCPFYFFGIEKSIYDLFIHSTNICLVLTAYKVLDLFDAGDVVGSETDTAPGPVESALISWSNKQSNIADLTGTVR